MTTYSDKNSKESSFDGRSSQRQKGRAQQEATETLVRAVRVIWILQEYSLGWRGGSNTSSGG